MNRRKVRAHTKARSRSTRLEHRPAVEPRPGYDARVILTPCLTCMASAGERCAYMGDEHDRRNTFLANPHPGRVKSARDFNAALENRQPVHHG